MGFLDAFKVGGMLVSFEVFVGPQNCTCNFHQVAPPLLNSKERFAFEIIRLFTHYQAEVVYQVGGPRSQGGKQWLEWLARLLEGPPIYERSVFSILGEESWATSGMGRFLAGLPQALGYQSSEQDELPSREGMLRSCGMETWVSPATGYELVPSQSFSVNDAFCFRGDFREIRREQTRQIVFLSKFEPPHKALSGTSALGLLEYTLHACSACERSKYLVAVLAQTCKNLLVMYKYFDEMPATGSDPDRSRASSIPDLAFLKAAGLS